MPAMFDNYSVPDTYGISILGQCAYIKRYVLDPAIAGERIMAIKNLRVINPLIGLKDAKDAVELLVGDSRDLKARDAALAEADKLYNKLNWRNSMRRNLSELMQQAHDNGDYTLRDTLQDAIDKLATQTAS